MRKWLQRWSIRYLTKHLFNTISLEDILHVKQGVYHYRGRPIDQERLERIRQSADVFADSVLWEILSNEVRFQLNKRMYQEAGDDNLLIGKSGLHVLDIIEKTLQRLKKEHNS